MAEFDDEELASLLDALDVKPELFFDNDYVSVIYNVSHLRNASIGDMWIDFNKFYNLTEYLEEFYTVNVEVEIE